MSATPERRERKKIEIPKCMAASDCPMTMGYYIGGGLHIYWAHAFRVPGMIAAIAGQKEVVLRGDRP